MPKFRLALGAVVVCEVAGLACAVGPDDELWITPGQALRSTQGLIWIDDGESVDIDFAESSPEFNDSVMWHDGVLVRARTAPDASGIVSTTHVSGLYAPTGRFSSRCIVSLSMLVNRPAELVAYADSLFCSEFQVTRPTRLDLEYGIAQFGRFDLQSQLSLAGLIEGGRVELFGDLDQDTGGSTRNASITLPAGTYELRVNTWLGVKEGEGVGLADLTAWAYASLQPSVGCNAADIAEPNGLLDVSDIISFLNAYAAHESSADLAWPPATIGVSDVLEFLGVFSAGCP